MLAIAAWAFDFSTLLAGYLGKTALAAHVVLLTVISFTFVSFPVAVGIAGSIRVGQTLGAADASAARAAARWTVALSGGFMTALAIVKLCVRRYLGRLFTNGLLLFFIPPLLPSRPFLFWQKRNTRKRSKDARRERTHHAHISLSLSSRRDLASLSRARRPLRGSTPYAPAGRGAGRGDRARDG